MVSTPLKNISQLGLLFPIYGKKCSKPPTRMYCLIYTLATLTPPRENMPFFNRKKHVITCHLQPHFQFGNRHPKQKLIEIIKWRTQSPCWWMSTAYYFEFYLLYPSLSQVSYTINIDLKGPADLLVSHPIPMVNSLSIPSNMHSIHFNTAHPKFPT